MKKLLCMLLCLLLLAGLSCAEDKYGLLAYFIDVGSGDSTLIGNGEYVVIIDAGEVSYGPAVVQSLISYRNAVFGGDKSIKLKVLLIGTHGHSDHIGGLSSVIGSMNNQNTNFIIEKLIMRDFSTLDRTTSTTIRNKRISYEVPHDGESILWGNISISLYCKNYQENNSSIVAKVEYKNLSILMAADAENELETSLIDSGIDLKADILKVGHHGSETGTSLAWLDAVQPSYAIISVGLHDKNGNPSQQTLDNLIYNHCTIWQTRYDGTIVLTSDGETYKLARETNDVDWKNKLLTANIKTKKIHLTDSPHVQNMSNINKAGYDEPPLEEGYTWCQSCKRRYDSLLEAEQSGSRQTER